jgi:hypothetical protein
MRTDKTKYGLIGPVKNVQIVTAQIEEQDGQIAEKPLFSHTIIFNKSGQVIEQLIRNPDGSEWRSVNDYTDSGNLLAMRNFDPKGALNSEVRYIYDANDRLTAEQRLDLDGRVITRTTYAYDDVGGKVKIEELDFPEKANMMIGIEGVNLIINVAEARRVESRYDDRDETVAVKVFNSDGALVTRVEITRDARGNSLEETQYIGDAFAFHACVSGSCSTEEMATLTEEQKAEVAQVFSPGNTMSKYTHRYDTEGRLIESKLIMMGMEVNRQTFAYDEAGNKSEEVSYNEGASVAKAIFTREYDTHGNWTMELVSNASSWDAEFELSTPARVTRRLITYW